MTADFAKVLTDVRARAEQTKFWASSALAKEPHPEFWCYACKLATRWSDALAADALDWSVLSRIREEAKIGKHRAGVWLLAWCNGVEKDYVNLRAASLSSQELRSSEERV